MSHIGLPTGVDYGGGVKTGWIDTLAVRLANLALRLTTERYRSLIGNAITYGFAAAGMNVYHGLRNPTEPCDHAKYWWQCPA